MMNSYDMTNDRIENFCDDFGNGLLPLFIISYDNISIDIL